LIPGVTHIDGTGRVQTITKEFNQSFYNLIHAFSKISGVPMLLNTSFNENEPVVRRPGEAINCFLRTEMDILVLENFVIERN
jgi:carbamoyltransferase